MPRFYCESLPPPPAAAKDGGLLDIAASLDADESHHARRVLRLAESDSVEVFDGRGRVGEGTIAFPSRDSAIVRLTQLRDVPPAATRIELAVAVPKGLRAEDMVNQLSQAGVARFSPLLAERSVVKPGEGKRERLARAAIESAKQCGRAWLMEVGEPITLEAALRDTTAMKLIAAPPHQGGRDGPLIDQSPRVLVLVGPEGGWTDRELALGDAAGAVRWRLGPHVMRIETAALAAAVLVANLAGL